MGLVMTGVAGGVRRGEMVIVVGEDVAGVMGGVRRDGLGAVLASGRLLVDTRL